MIARLLLALLIALMIIPPANADIVIGAAGPMSGQYADLGEQLRRGAEQAVADINEAGGVNGQQLKLEIADDRCDANTAAYAARDLVAKNAVLVVGHYCSQASIAAATVYALNRVLMISPASSANELTDNGPWNVFRTIARDDAQGLFAARYLARGFKDAEIAVLDDGTPYFRSLAARVLGYLDAAGIAIAMSGSFKPGEKDFEALALRVKQSRAIVLYAAGNDTDLGRLIRQIREGGSSVRLVSTDALSANEFWQASGPAGEATMFSFPADPRSSPAAQTVLAKFAAAKYPAEGATLPTYAAIQAWARAASANNMEPRATANWLRAGNTIPTVIGNIAFDEKGDLRNPSFNWLVWRSGVYELE